MPRIGKVNVGQIIGDLGPTPERAQTCAQFIAEVGIVPVTRASGMSHSVSSDSPPTSEPARPRLRTCTERVGNAVSLGVSGGAVRGPHPSTQVGLGHGSPCLTDIGRCRGPGVGLSGRGCTPAHAHPWCTAGNLTS
ncbi:hypothetical protein [Streptomyces sp. NPDC127039]|uniref:hypothetical protein n=1 Tax=Streptomyces sp. NPDC127039 TaxID=3347115 RepID=UPI0036627989